MYPKKSARDALKNDWMPMGKKNEGLQKSRDRQIVKFYILIQDRMG